MMKTSMRHIPPTAQLMACTCSGSRSSLTDIARARLTGSRLPDPSADHSIRVDVSAAIWTRGMLSLGVSLRVYVLGRLALQKTHAVDMAATGLCSGLVHVQPMSNRGAALSRFSCTCSCVKKAEKRLLCGKFSNR